VKTSVRKRSELMAPRVPGLGKPMAQDDERPDAGLGNVHADAIGLDDSVVEFQGSPPLHRSTIDAE
jgi:hypothetical protein